MLALLVERIPEGERDSVIAYNLNSGFYLWFDIRPCYRFFNWQDWTIRCNESSREPILHEFECLEAR